jgi:hypothetical protein
LTLTLILSVGSIVMAPPTVEAHQPFCEFADLTFDTAWPIEDATISVAFYANMYPATDVDYYTFEAEYVFSGVGAYHLNGIESSVWTRSSSHHPRV